MSELSIVEYGSDILRKPSSAVTVFDKKLEKLADNMLQAMYEENGVGLAAPQIGINQRIIVIDVDYASNRYEEENDKSKKPVSGEPDEEYNPYIMINPIIVYKEGEMDSYEGCLSFPSVFFHVKRSRKIVFKFQDLKGNSCRMEAEGDLFCRCVQHEIDHLDGILFVDKAIDKIESQIALDEHGFKGVKSQPRSILI